MLDVIGSLDLPAGLGYAGAAAGMAWPLCRGRRAILVAQLISNALFTAHYALLGADTGAALSAMSVAQTAAAIPLGERPGFRWVYLATLPVIAALLALTWNGTPSILASAGTAFNSLGRWQTEMFRMRAVLFLAGPCWFAHNLLVMSVPGLCTDVVSAALNVRALAGLARERRESRAAV